MIYLAIYLSNLFVPHFSRVFSSWFILISFSFVLSAYLSSSCALIHLLNIKVWGLSSDSLQLQDFENLISVEATFFVSGASKLGLPTPVSLPAYQTYAGSCRDKDDAKQIMKAQERSERMAKNGCSICARRSRGFLFIKLPIIYLSKLYCAMSRPPFFLMLSTRSMYHRH